MKLPASDIGDPLFRVELPDGSIHEASLWKIGESLDDIFASRVSLEEKCRKMREAFGVGEISPHQCLTLCAEVMSRRAEIFKARTGMAQWCELLHFYPGLSPSELRALDPEDLLLLTYQMNRIEASQRLALIADTAAAMSNEEPSRLHQLELARVAYRDNERALNTATVVLQRSN